MEQRCPRGAANRQQFAVADPHISPCFRGRDVAQRDGAAPALTEPMLRFSKPLRASSVAVKSASVVRAAEESIMELSVSDLELVQVLPSVEGPLATPAGNSTVAKVVVKSRGQRGAILP